MIYKIEKSKTALLVIDAQKEYSQKERPLFIDDFSEVAKNINQLSELFREKNMPVVIIKQVYDARGNDIGRMGDFSEDDAFDEKAGYTGLDENIIFNKDKDIVIQKNRYSAFVNTNLEGYLKTLGIDTVVITGFMTNYCCESTARHAHDLDYKVIYATDATSAPYFGNLGFGDFSLQTLKAIVSSVLSGGIAEVVNTEEIIERIK